MIEEVGRYRILEKIGQGGFAVVYRAQDTVLEREVALKELHQRLLNDEEGITCFIREARTIARLQHPHIVPIHDVLDIENRLLIVMPLIAGSSLDQVLAEQGRLAWPQVLEIMQALAAALTYAHEQGILHRDLKPANILLDPTAGAQLSDFGLAKLADEAGGSVTATGGIVGTPQYIAPERLSNPGANDPRSDIYSFGAVAYFLLTGRDVQAGRIS